MFVMWPNTFWGLVSIHLKSLPLRYHVQKCKTHHRGSKKHFFCLHWVDGITTFKFKNLVKFHIHIKNSSSIHGSYQWAMVEIEAKALGDFILTIYWKTFLKLWNLIAFLIRITNCMWELIWTQNFEFILYNVLLWNKIRLQCSKMFSSLHRFRFRSQKEVSRFH